MATVAEVSDPYANFLLPTLGRGEGVCEVCRTSVTPGWSRCFQCGNGGGPLALLPDAVDFVALAVKGEQLARELWLYKHAPQPAVRAQLQLRPAAVLWRWLAGHETCLAATVGIRSFEVVTVVPSTTTVTPESHQLRQMVSAQIGPTLDRYADMLRVNPAAPQNRSFDADRWQVRSSGAESVLLIDDTWTSGGHAFSAVEALKQAGVGKVAVLAIGRHFARMSNRPEYQEAAESYYRRAKALGWDWDTCSTDRDNEGHAH